MLTQGAIRFHFWNIECTANSPFLQVRLWRSDSVRQALLFFRERLEHRRCKPL